MSPNFIPIAVATSLLIAATLGTQALPPRQQPVSGVVEVVDCASRTITLKPKDGAAPLTFVWNESTRFSRKDGCAKRSFDSGQTVRVSYHCEVRQNVLREASSKGASADCGAVCK
ncbi:MAG: hypothetical protein HY043_08080 [Verrucomicrobia bacterium]|nr:hypothetical protein [Verrucomicrobiota bacterium]